MRYSIAAGAAILAAQTLAHPVIGELRNNQIERRVVDLDKFRLTTLPEYKATDELPASINSISKRADYVSTAQEVVKEIAPKAEYRLVEDHYVGSNGIAHVHFKQTAHGLDIDTADFNVNIAKDGTVFSYGNSFFEGAIPEASPLTKRDFVDPVAALKGVSSILALSVGTEDATVKADEAKETYTIQKTSNTEKDPKAKLVYTVAGDKLSLAWRVETDLGDDWLLSYVDAATSENIQGVVNYKNDASYQVFPWGINDPDEGGRQTISNPWDTKASEFTWQGDGSSTYSVTRGNNGIAQANYEGDNAYLNDYRPDSGSNGSFVYPLDLTATDPKKNAAASVTQLWYTANHYHDLLYELGFTEAAGNFETNVHGQGGIGNDAVILNAIDGSGTNNANFATPPDGQAGRMRMYIWDQTTPKRDCSFEAGVVIHEYTHGLSNRLTGGPANSACLNVLEAGGMGEGWGDFMATAIRTNTSDSRATNYPMGAWIYGDPLGIRDYLYSTSLTTNPLTYKSMNTLNEVHALGTYWANTLYELMWNLIDLRGNTNSAVPVYDSKGVPTDGRYLTMKLVVDAMALQPCNPTMPQARDAILDADKNLTGGSNACAIWTAFAKRGLGSKAKRNTGTARTEDYTIPTGIC